MFKKFSYLASVSILATLAMTQVGQTMDPPEDDEKPVKIGSQKNTSKNIVNARYYGSSGLFGEVDPRNESWPISKAAAVHFFDNLNEKTDTFRRIIRQARSGNYDELAGEAIEMCIASLAGETQKSFFAQSKKELDPKVLAKASKNLVNKLLKKLSENSELYGETNNGEKVTIYNKSLFKMFAKQCFPEIPFTGAAISFLDNGYVKNFIEEKLIETASNFLISLFEDRGMTLKETLGHQAVKLVSPNSKQEKAPAHEENKLSVSPNHKQETKSTALWEYLEPHFNHHLRSFVLSLLEEQKEYIIKKVESDLWYWTVPTTGVISYLASSYASPIIYGAGSMLNSPSLQIGGYLCSTVAGSAGVGLTGMGIANSYFHATKDYISKWLDNKFLVLAHDLIPLSKEEHALFGLNETPTDLEKGLFFDDYNRRAELNSQSFLRSALKTMSEKSGVDSILRAIFGEDALTDPFQIKYCVNEEQEQASRQLALLKIMDSEQAKEVEENLRKYPSFNLKIKHLQNLKHVPLDNIVKEEAEAQEYAHSTKNVVKQVRGVAAKIVAELCTKYEQLPDSRDPFYRAFAEELLSSSIESQDHIIEWVKNQPNELKEFIKSFAEQTNYKDLFEGDAKSPNKEKIKNFVTSLMQKCVQKYIDEVNKAYSEKHQYPIELLLAKPLTEGMDQPQVLRLHKQLVRPENQSIFDLLGDDIPPRMLRLLNDEDLVKLARTSPEFYKLSNDIIDERKSIKLFDLKDLKTLSPEEERYFAKYRHDMLLINAAYHKLKLDHLAYALFEILENHMVQTNALEIIKYDIIQEYSSKRNSGIPSFEEVTKKVLAAVTKNEEFQKASTLIKKIKDAPEADPELNTKYVKQRFLWQVEIAKEILEAIKRGEKPANIRSTSAATDLIYQLTPAFLKKDKYTLTQEIVNETFEDAKVKLGDHDITSKGWQVSNLLHTLKDMKFPDHSKVTIRDFIEIHKYIMKFKMLEANEFDKKYIEKYGEAIYPYKLKSPLFRNKLFYGIDEVIHMIRTHNREFLKVLFSMKEEE